jgi:hypothetical protein
MLRNGGNELLCPPSVPPGLTSELLRLKREPRLAALPAMAVHVVAVRVTSAGRWS